MSRRPPVLSLQGWLLAILMPALGLLIVAYAILVYHRLHAAILEGFDDKLSAVSTTTAGFIDPAEHERLMEPLPLTSLTHDPKGNDLWALDSSEHRLLKIRTDDGVAEETGINLPRDVNLITNGLKDGELYVLDTGAGHLLHFAFATGATTPAFDVPPPISAVATTTTRRWIFVAGRTLRRVELDTGRIVELGALPEMLRDLSYDHRGNELWALSARGDELLEINADNAAIRSRKKLVLQKTDPADPGPPQPVELKTISQDAFTSRLFGTNTSLVQVDRATGVVSVQDYLPSFGQEKGPLYQRYAAPMTHILARANLTYLYTQIVQGRDHIVYGLDGTVGKDHSPLLSTDTVRDEEIDGTQRLMTEGAIYVSAIEPWPPWGLLKSSLAPIFNDQGRPVAMAGADVNAGFIQFKIRRALVITFAFGAAMLVVGGILSLVIARRLTGPLGAIKTGAMRAAAGDLNQRTEVARPRELRQLAQRFTTASATLGREMQALRENLSGRQAARDRAGLLERLVKITPLALSAPAGAPWAWGEVGRRPDGAGPPGGAVTQADQTLAWISSPINDPLKAGARRAEIAATARALLARFAADPAALGAALEKLFPAEIAAWALLGPGGLRVSLRRPGLLFRRSPGGQSSELTSAGFAAILRPEPGDALILASPGAPLAAVPPVPSAPAAGLFEAWRKAAAAGPAAFAVVGALGAARPTP